MTTATLTKWGNGQGVNIPKAICEELGLSIGDHLALVVLDGGIHMRPTSARSRTRKVSATELFSGWDGAYEPPSDWPTDGCDVVWGDPVGNEVW